MHAVDTRDNPRIAITLEMLREVSRQTDPNAAVAAFGARYGALFPHDYYLSASVRGLEPGQYKITRSIASATVHGNADALQSQNPWRDTAST